MPLAGPRQSCSGVYGAGVMPPCAGLYPVAAEGFGGCSGTYTSVPNSHPIFFGRLMGSAVWLQHCRSPVQCQSYPIFYPSIVFYPRRFAYVAADDLGHVLSRWQPLAISGPLLTSLLGP